MRFVLILFLLFCSPALGQSVKITGPGEYTGGMIGLRAEVSDADGSFWLCFKNGQLDPPIIDGGSGWDLVNDVPNGRVLFAPKIERAMTYTFTVVAFKADKKHVATHVIRVGKPDPDPDPEPEPDPEPDPEPEPGPDPKPDPEPEPGPDPKPDPKPVPGPYWIILLEETDIPDEATARIKNDTAFWESLKADGHKYRWYDDDSPEATARQLAGLTPERPMLFIQSLSGEIIKAVRLPADVAGIRAILKEVSGK